MGNKEVYVILLTIMIFEKGIFFKELTILFEVWNQKKFHLTKKKQKTLIFFTRWAFTFVLSKKQQIIKILLKYY